MKHPIRHTIGFLLCAPLLIVIGAVLVLLPYVAWTTGDPTAQANVFCLGLVVLLGIGAYLLRDLGM